MKTITVINNEGKTILVLREGIKDVCSLPQGYMITVNHNKYFVPITYIIKEEWE